MSEQRNVILAVVLSLAIILVFQFFLFPQSSTDQQPPVNQAGDGISTPPSQGELRLEQRSEEVLLQKGNSNAAASAVPSISVMSSQTDATTAGPETRISIDTPSLHGSISLIGGHLDTLTLVKYHISLNPQSSEITMLTPASGDAPYYVDFGWVPAGTNTAVPIATTRWTTDAQQLTVDKPVTLTWVSTSGVVYQRIFSVDENYMLTVKQRVENYSKDAITLAPYQVIYRYNTPQTEGIYLLYEGPLGVIDGTLRERNYKDLRENNKIFKEESIGGWVGITDKYWLVALAPQQEQKIVTRFLHQTLSSTDVYQVDYVGTLQTLSPGNVGEFSGYVFAGAKEAQLLDHYVKLLGIKKFDLAIDFGWFSFLTKPFFHALTFLHKLVGNFGVAILLFTVAIKILVFPLANKSYQAMSKMKRMQPEIKKLQERFHNDRLQLNQEMMAFYRKEKVNPAAGCLPVLIQVPIFFALYKVLFITIEMRHAPFFGWVQDLSAPDPTNLLNLFGLIPWNPPALLHVGVWPVIMGFTMWWQQRMNPQPTDPVQARIFSVLPVIFTLMLAQFSAGLVIYWAWNNVLSIFQQWIIARKVDKHL